MTLAIALFAAAQASSCAACHRAEAAAQARTPMAHALETVRDCDILKTHPLLSFRRGAYSYAIRRDGDHSLYSVTNGSETITAPLAWAFGLGAAGQTYVYERGGSLYESRVSFYNALQGLDLTMGAGNAEPHTLEEAAGRKMDDSDARACFSCHATGAVRGSALVVDTLDPGVKCARCHRNSEEHVRAMRSGDNRHSEMINYSQLGAEDISELCGECHRTWAQIAASGPHGILNVRFQPYRLTNSKCYDTADRRIACTACHNPHDHASANTTSYDSKCQACHNRSSASIRKCRVATARCVSCHMPKIELPGAHFAFTDHWIRIVRAGEPYPN